MGLPNNWKEQISDETIFQIILPENEEYFGYMDVETLINTSISEFLNLYRSYNRDEGMNLFKELQDKIKKHHDMKWIDVHSGKLFYSDEELIKYIRCDGMKDIVYYVEKIRKYDEDLIEHISQSLS